MKTRSLAVSGALVLVVAALCLCTPALAVQAEGAMPNKLLFSVGAQAPVGQFDTPTHVAVGLGGLANSPWPMLGYDLKHSGRSPYCGPSNPGIIWTFRMGDFISYGSPEIDSDGTVYVGGGDGVFYALNPDGTVKWFYQVSGPVFTGTTPAIAADGTVYYGTHGTDTAAAAMYAFRPNGTLKWRYSMEPGAAQVGWFSCPAIAPDGTIYVGGGGTG